MAMMVNAGAQFSLGELNNNTNEVGKSLARISSGMKINSAGDNSADYAISERMRAQIRALTQNTQNVQNGSALVKTAERGIDQIIQNLRTMKEKAIDAANDSNSDEDRQTIQKEFEQLMATINEIAVGTQYNGKVLLDGRYGRQGSAAMDIVFVVDTTGSMGTPIQNLANNLEAFTSSLKNQGYSLNLGLVKYGDINETTSIGVESVLFGGEEFTSDVGTLVSALNNLSVAGGGDLPESGLEGVVEALKYSFRDSAQKKIIAISDINVHKKETGKSDYTLDDVLKALNSKNVNLSAVTKLDTVGKDDWGFLADGTGGNLYSISEDYGIQLRKEAASYGNVKKSDELWIHHGTQSGQRINVYINSLQTKDLQGEISNEADKAQLAAWSHSPEKQTELQTILDVAKDMTLEDAKVTTVDNAKVAIRVVEGALDYALNEATNMGAYLQKFDFTGANISTMSENAQNTESIIRDTDIAKEMTRYTRYSILAQASQTMLAQAVNQSSRSVLGLLQEEEGS